MKILGLQGLGTELGILNLIIVLCIIIALIIYKYGPPKQWGKKKNHLNTVRGNPTTIAILQQSFEDCKEGRRREINEVKESVEKVEDRLGEVEKGIARIEGRLGSRSP